jgi:hypothetical protein
MPLSKQEIIDYASRYVSVGENADFPFDEDLFCLLERKIPEGRVLADEEGWSFRGYGICTGYTLDNEAKPAGKWVWMHFASLSIFPPSPEAIKLQPPHVVNGRFQDPGRTREYRIIKVNLKQSGTTIQKCISGRKKLSREKTPAGSVVAAQSKIVQFRRRIPTL